MMFCTSCGTELSEDSAFCHNCGATAPRVAPSAEPPAPSPPVAAQPRAPAPTTAPTPAKDGFRIVIVAGAIIGAALVLIGTFLPWISVQLLGAEITENGFDGGYITDAGDGDGTDGVLTLLISLAAGGLAVLYLYRRSALSTLGILALGIAAGAVGGYNFGKIVDDASAAFGVSTSDAVDYVGEGLYIVIVGGLVMAVAALIGLVAGRPSGVAQRR